MTDYRWRSVLRESMEIFSYYFACTAGTFSDMFLVRNFCAYFFFDIFISVICDVSDLHIVDNGFSGSTVHNFIATYKSVGSPTFSIDSSVCLRGSNLMSICGHQRNFVTFTEHYYTPQYMQSLCMQQPSSVIFLK